MSARRLLRVGTAGLLLLAVIFLGCKDKVPTAGVEPASIRIVSPGSGDVVSGNIRISTETSGDVDTDQTSITIDGMFMAQRNSWVWRSGWTKDGTHTIFARSQDASGSVIYSDTVVVHVQNTVSPGVNNIQNAEFDDELASWEYRNVNAPRLEYYSEPHSAFIYSDTGYLYQDIEGFHCEEGQIFVLRFWHRKMEGVFSTGKVFVQCRSYDPDSTEIMFEFDSTIEWDESRIEFDAPLTAGEITRLRFEIDVGQIYFDDVGFMRKE